MKICLISVEIFAWDKYGGFGRATRTIGRELVKRGIEVCAIVPRRKGQNEVDKLDGITVYGFSKYFPWNSKKFLKMCNADIFHSCEPSFTTYLAIKQMPGRKHLVTFRDPRDFNDWKMEFDLPSLNRFQVLQNYIFENNFLVQRCIKHMDSVFVIAKYLCPKVKRMYSLRKEPKFLPTPVEVPGTVKKAEQPTVCYLARMDRRKRPNLYLELAHKFPKVKFIAVGKSRNKAWGDYLKKKYCTIPNIEMTGFIDQFQSDRLSKLLEKSWIMVNTATREALPNSFLEAAAHKCALLSHVNPDGFASEFGYHAKNDDFEKGLIYLLENQRWREKGEKGYQYVKDTFEMDTAIDQHIAIYQNLLK